ncbi:hypothetical protein ACFQ60_09495 [Streptomyces zhihengii]
MGGRLHGQQTLHEDFVPRLVGLHHTGNYQVPWPSPRAPRSSRSSAAAAAAGPR